MVLTLVIINVLLFSFFLFQNLGTKMTLLDMFYQFTSLLNNKLIEAKTLIRFCACKQMNVGLI
jgi:hypothetical protein